MGNRAKNGRLTHDHIFCRLRSLYASDYEDSTFHADEFSSQYRYASLYSEYSVQQEVENLRISSYPKK